MHGAKQRHEHAAPDLLAELVVGEDEELLEESAAASELGLASLPSWRVTEFVFEGTLPDGKRLRVS